MLVKCQNEKSSDCLINQFEVINTEFFNVEVQYKNLLFLQVYTQLLLQQRTQQLDINHIIKDHNLVVLPKNMQELKILDKEQLQSKLAVFLYLSNELFSFF